MGWGLKFYKRGIVDKVLVSTSAMNLMSQSTIEQLLALRVKDINLITMDAIFVLKTHSSSKTTGTKCQQSLQEVKALVDKVKILVRLGLPTPWDNKRR